MLVDRTLDLATAASKGGSLLQRVRAVRRRRSEFERVEEKRDFGDRMSFRGGAGDLS